MKRRLKQIAAVFLSAIIVSGFVVFVTLATQHKSVMIGFVYVIIGMVIIMVWGLLAMLIMYLWGIE